MLTAECKRHSGVGSRKHYTSNSAYKVDFLEHWKIRILAFFWSQREAGAGAIGPWASPEIRSPTKGSAWGGEPALPLGRLRLRQAQHHLKTGFI